MKKSLLALAVLGAFTSIASAQSSVTLYGRVDQNVTLQDPGKNALISGIRDGKMTTKLNDGGTNGFGSSRIGFKGTEDLGDGLKAFFQLEAGVTPDTGAAGSGSSFFSRGAYLGLAHKTLGEIRLGRQETLTRENNVKINDISGENSLTVTETLQDSADKNTRPLFQNVGARINNGIRYTTPSFAGIQASAIVGLGEREKNLTNTGSNQGTTKVASYRGLAVVYTGGPLALNVIYEDLSGGVVGGSNDYNNVVTVGGSYDFGFAKVVAAYQDTNNFGPQTANIPAGATGTSIPNIFSKGVDVEAWNIGVAVPFNAFTFRAQYTGSTIDKKSGVAASNLAPNKSSLDQHKYGASLHYALSKRTLVYASATQRGGDDKDFFVRKSEFGIGVGHNF